MKTKQNFTDFIFYIIIGLISGIISFYILPKMNNLIFYCFIGGIVVGIIVGIIAYFCELFELTKPKREKDK